jgi:hypothetical protein
MGKRRFDSLVVLRGQPGSRRDHRDGAVVFHVIDATVMVLMWNFGTAVLFVGRACSAGQCSAGWVAPRTLYAREQAFGTGRVGERPNFLCDSGHQEDHTPGCLVLIYEETGKE